MLRHTVAIQACMNQKLFKRKVYAALVFSISNCMLECSDVNI